MIKIKYKLNIEFDTWSQLSYSKYRVKILPSKPKGQRKKQMYSMKIKPDTKCFSAILIKDISYNKHGVMIEVPIHTMIIVDLDQEIALINGDHLFIAKEEYSLLD